jgi:uncharacterized protein YndB with AHSA1/START domain
MEKLHFRVEVSAPAEQVYAAMLDDATYREWTGEIWPGSRYEGNWQPGSTIRFLGSDADGPVSGMVAKVLVNRPNDFVSLEYVGLVVDGLDDSTSETAQGVVGMHESYRFGEARGVTTLNVDVEVANEYGAMMSDEWPKALAKLKEVAER